MLNLTNLRSFWMVARTGSFRAAAQALNVSQPALSRQVQELEKKYNTLLLKRSGTGSEPTEIGRHLFDQAEMIFEQVNRAEMFLSNGSSRSLAIHSVTNARLAAILGRLTRTITTDIKVTIDTGSKVEAALLRGECDLALLTLTENHDLDVEQIQVGSFGTHCIVPPSHLASQKSEIRATDLHKQPIVVKSKGSRSREIFDRYMLKMNIQPDVIFEVNCVESIIEIAHELNAIAVFSDTGQVSEGLITTRKLVDAELTVPLHLAILRSPLSSTFSGKAFQLLRASFYSIPRFSE